MELEKAAGLSTSPTLLCRNKDLLTQVSDTVERSSSKMVKDSQTNALLDKVKKTQENQYHAGHTNYGDFCLQQNCSGKPHLGSRGISSKELTAHIVQCSASS